MEELVKVICPSSKRADRVMTKDVVPNMAICVPESEKAEYSEHNPDNEIITHPDSIIGLPLKRQWIYETFGDIFMLDDDIAYMRDWTCPPGKNETHPPEVAYELIQRLAWMAKEMGAYLFGFNHLVRPMFVHPQQPYTLTGFIPGHSMGIFKGSKLYWHKRATTVCDYWISSLNAYHHRFVLKDLHYGFLQTKTFKGAGGQAQHRNMKVEVEATRFLKEHFGEVIQNKGETAVKRSHEAMRYMKLPY
jgi:hypothetical protein